VARGDRERHRHRYEFNPDTALVLENDGLIFVAFRRIKKIVEMVELPREIHPWFLGCQFHPEYKSKPLNAHPLLLPLFVRPCKPDAQ